MPRAVRAPSKASSGKPGRPRSAAAEEAILAATLRILYEEGYTALTSDRVAAMAKVSKATIYRRWPTKEHLALAVMERLPIPEPVEAASFEDELVALFSHFDQILKESPIQSVLPRLAGECAGNPALSAAMIRVNDRRREPMRVLLRRAIARGELLADLNLEIAIDLIQGAVAVRALFLLDRLSPEWVRSLAHIIKTGIAAPAAPRAARRSGPRRR